MGTLFDVLWQLQQRPGLIAELLRSPLAFPVPYFAEAHVEPTLRHQLSPTLPPPDLIITLNEAVQPSGIAVPVLAVVVEALTACESEKRFAWPFYAAALRAKLRCPTCVVVLTPDAIVERWARQSIHTGQPESSFRPLVVGPPVVEPDELDDATAGLDELRMFSLLNRGNGGNYA